MPTKNNLHAKINRTIHAVLPIAKTRVGQCVNCGKCCHLPKKCIFLRKKTGGISYCAIYKIRPLNCRKYPRNTKECLTPDTCGYKFL